jgi:hypothetical protein
VSEVFTVIPEACEAAAVKLVGVVVKRFADVSLVVGVKFIQFFQQRERLASDETGHVKGGFFLFSHLCLRVRGISVHGGNDTDETREDAHDTGY